MEELKKLEERQMMMAAMESNVTIETPYDHHHSSYGDSHRFLSKFAHFLTEPCGDLSIGDKCRLISDQLPKISATVKDDELKLPCVQSVDRTEKKDVCLIGFDAMQRANSTLEDFCRSYFMFHGMDPNRAESVFRYLPVLSFIESYIYQLDTLNERMSHPVIPVETNGTDPDQSLNMEQEPFDSDPLKPVVLLLEQHGLLTERTREELRCGEEYWTLERKLCGGLDNKTEVSILLKDVTRAIHLKSFDYRVLNLLLYQLRGNEVNELHMEFLSASELLVEIADDLFDYEEDVLENNFNILRMFVLLYGTSKAPAMLAKYIAEVEENYDKLLEALDPQLSENYKRRCEEATREGGSVSDHPLGSWTIPPLIADEELYRSTFGDHAAKRQRPTKSRRDVHALSS